MNIYEIYVDNKQNDLPLRLLKASSSLLAGLTTPLWALYHKMWLIAILTMILTVTIYCLKDHVSTAYLGMSGHLLCALFFGLFASDIRAAYLKSKGYILQDIVLANSETEAELKFYAKINQYQATSQ